MCLEGQSGFNLSLQCSSCRRAPWSELQKRILLQFAQDKLHLLHLIKSCLFIFWFLVGWLGFHPCRAEGIFSTQMCSFSPQSWMAQSTWSSSTLAQFRISSRATSGRSPFAPQGQRKGNFVVGYCWGAEQQERSRTERGSRKE